MKKKIGFLDLIQTVAIVLGIVFALLELSQMREERSRQAAAELARSFQTPELMEGVTTALRMPDGASADEVLQHFQGNDALLNQTAEIFETVGILVYRGEIDLWLVDDLMGGAAITFWNKTRAYWEYWRREMDRPAIAEWTQWLAERLAELDTSTQPPAYEAFRDWEPSG
ncbi:MAG: hypothetical protein PVJ02_04050 [Gemmatimonadota bacterium]|jgi:hypothetical protein